MPTTYINDPSHPFHMQVSEPIEAVIDGYLQKGYRLDFTESFEVYGLWGCRPAEHLRAQVHDGHHFIALSDLPFHRHPEMEPPHEGETATYDNVLRKNHGLD